MVEAANVVRTFKVFRDRNGHDARVFEYPLVEVAQEIPAVVLVAFPGVLAVHGNGHKRRREPVPDRSADIMEPVQTIPGGILRIRSLVMERYQVGELLVAEDDLYIPSAFLVTVMLIEDLGVDDIPLVIAARPPPQALEKDIFIGGDPGDVVLDIEPEGLVAHRAFRRPHTLRPRPEHIFEEIESRRDLVKDASRGHEKRVFGRAHPGMPSRALLVSMSSGTIG